MKINVRIEQTIQKSLSEKSLLFEIMTLPYYGEQCLDNRIAMYLNGELIGYTNRKILALYNITYRQ